MVWQMGMSQIRITERDVETFSRASKDKNPLHMSDQYARRSPFGERVVHGVLGVLICLSKSRPVTDMVIDQIHADFHEPLYINREYTVDCSEMVDSTVHAKIFEGRRVLLEVRFTYRDGQPSCDWKKTHEVRHVAEAKHWTDADIQIGTTIRGEYEPGWEDLGFLIETYGLSTRGAGPMEIAILLFSSYAIGMELPGRRALFSKLSVEMLTASGKMATAGSYLSRVDSFNASFGALRLQAEFAQSNDTVARLALRAFVRSELAPVRTDLITANLAPAESLKGRVALVTGGSRGLGASLVLALAHLGAEVYINYHRSHDAAQEVRQAAEKMDGNVYLLAGDSSDPSWCEEACERIKREHGRLDILLCNAWPSLQSVWIEPAQSKRVAEYVQQGMALTNVPFGAFAELLSSSKGSVVAISTVAVQEPVADWPHYVSAKAAVEGFLKVAALQYPDIRVVIARPPRLRTDLTNTPLSSRTALLPELAAAHIIRCVLQESGRGEVVLVDDFKPSTPAHEAELVEEPQPSLKPNFVIAATFTAEPLADALHFWSEEAKLGLEPVFAPYHQIFQELLNPESLLNQNSKGVHALLLRVEDWFRYSSDQLEKTQKSLPNPEEFHRLSIRYTEELIEAIQVYKTKSNVPLIVCLCPESPEFANVQAYKRTHEEIEKRLADEIRSLAGTYFVLAADYAQNYKVDKYYDARRDEMGHIPYTRSYYTVLGTILSRAARSILEKPYKVIVLDCDNTLWKGVCGEDGPSGVEIGAAHVHFQKCLVKQQEQGVLLCLCSKNVEEDAVAVFKQRTDMPLGLEHITAQRINWLPKSDNIREIAKELGLGLDSFVFIDDNPVEIAEVESQCPEVLCLRIPTTEEELRTFVDHVWIFDHLKVTEEDRKRTQMYREQQERQRYQSSTRNFGDFLAGLNLQVHIDPISPEQVPRVAQLTQRTNQFNFTTIRRDEAAIADLNNQPDWNCWTAQVRDRFGDYGLVGAIITRKAEEALIIDTFLLSCRVLGRGVEHRMLSAIGDFALQSGLHTIRIEFVPTPKNQPALRFIESLPCSSQRTESNNRIVYELLAREAVQLEYVPVEKQEEGATVQSEEKKQNAPTKPVDTSQHSIYKHITRTLNSVGAIESQIYGIQENAAVVEKTETDRPVLAYLQDIFADALSLKKEALSQHVHFDTLSLTSMKIIEITVRLEEDFGTLPSTLLFEHKTLESLARYLADEHGTALSKIGPSFRMTNTAELPVEKLPAKESQKKPAITDKTSKYEHRDGIAIVGLAGRYPQANDLDDFWRNLFSGKECAVEVPQDRWDHELFYDSSGKNKQKSYSKWGAFIQHHDCFDSLFFNIAPREAEVMDPQQRVFLEVAYSAIEDAGYTRQTIGKDVGVFAGVMAHDYQQFNTHGALMGTSQYPYSDLYQVANRISYFFDFTGPSLSIDTACSSSGVALHMACEAIRAGECRAAIAGGINLIMHPVRHIQYSQMKMISMDGKCRAFGQDAQGFVMGEGAGAVLLKSLSDAIRDRDHIYGIIRATATNSGGRTSGFTVPNPNAQAALINSAIEKSGIDPRTISYVEAHGTGTPLGDPIEVRGLQIAFENKTQDKQFCAIGSLKPNIGHLEPAAAIAGLTKILLQMKHEKFAPSLHTDVTNPQIKFDTTAFYVQREAGVWKRPSFVVDGNVIEAPRRAGLSSFGAGGVNAHLIVEEYVDQLEKSNAKSDEKQVIVFSARDKERLHELLIKFSAYMDHTTNLPALENMAFTLQTGREEMEERLALIVSSHTELRTLLDEVLQGNPNSELICQGNVKDNRIVAEALGDDEETALYLKALVSGRKLERMARLWTQGVTMPWDILHANKELQKVSLPTYPFARIRHWIPNADPSILGSRAQSAQSTKRAEIHPLLGEKTKDSAENELITKLSGKEFYLVDHVVNGLKVFPGVAYLEMILSSVKQKLEQSAYKLTDVVWVQPIVSSNQNLNVRTSFQTINEGISFSIRTGDSVNQALHAQARVHSSPPSGKETAREDIEQIRARCTKVLATSDVYSLLQKDGFMYGPTFQVIREHRVGKDEAFSKLEVPVRDGSFHGWGLYPPILDGALQTVITANGTGDTYLPFSLQELIVWGPTPERCYAHVQYLSKDKSAVRCNVKLFDCDGHVVVEMRELTLRAAGKKEKNSPAEISKTVLYTPLWLIQDAVLPAQGTSDHLLVIDHGRKRFDEIRLRTNHASMFLVVPSTSFAHNDDQFQMNMADETHYERILAQIPSSGSLTILHFGHLEGTGVSIQEQLVHSFLLAKTLIRQRPDQPTTVLHYVEEENNEPFAMAMAGLARSIARESLQVKYRVIQVENGSIASENAARYDLFDKNDDVTFLRYNRQGKWRASYQEISDVEQTGDTIASRPRLRHKGVYLLTGGSGGLSLLFGQYLAEKYQARLILVGRSLASEQIQNAMRNWEAFGAEVIYQQADVTKTEEVKMAITSAKEKFSRIHGVLHTAGVIEDAYVSKKNSDAFQRVLAPKITGTCILDEWLKDEHLDFFVLFSSVASVFGNAGQTDYAAANGYMDGFAAWRSGLVERGMRHGKSLSVNWPLWEQGGMQVSVESKKLTETTLGLKTLDTEQGMSAFERALRSDASQVVVTVGHKDRVEKAMQLLRSEKKQVGSEKNGYVANASLNDSDLENKVVEDLILRVSRLLKVSEADIDPADDMSDYGFDSIAVTELTNELNELYNLMLTPVLFFNNPTLTGLARVLVTQYRDSIYPHYDQQTVPFGQLSSDELAEQHLPESDWEKQSMNDKPMHREEDVQADAIAIIGMAGRFPGSSNIREFWEHLKNGDDLVSEVPTERWDWQEYFGDATQEKNRSHSKWGGFLSDIAAFDAEFFQISPREAITMDPQQRLFLEAAWHAIEDAGYRQSDLSGTRTGVFAGVTLHDYYELIKEQGVNMEAHCATGNVHSVLPNRVSYLMNLKGPSEPIDTACSSSLVAIHRAISALRAGDCEIAIAGGVNALLSPSMFIAFSQAGMLAKDGRCKTFDQRADGYVRGEGVGAIILKPLRQAIADNDTVHAVIRGSAVNHGGHANSLTAPTPNAQADVVSRAIERAGIEPESISYIETHGTGTSLGDPIEIEGLKNAFESLGWNSETHAKGFCGLGAVKTNIGHLESASGMAGIMKVVLAMRHGSIPPTIHFQQMNPYIQLENSPFYLVRTLVPWDRKFTNDGNIIPRRAGVSSFGFGGVNAHVVLEEHTPFTEAANEERKPQIIVLSAMNKERLDEYVHHLCDFLTQAGNKGYELPALSDFAYTLQVGREEMPARFAVVVGSYSELEQRLRDYFDRHDEGIPMYFGMVDRKQRDTSKKMEAVSDLGVLVREQKWEQLASKWTTGASIDWRLLYPAPNKPKRVSLPGYPFARKRFWLPKPALSNEWSRKAVERQEQLHPSHSVEATNQQQNGIMLHKQWYAHPLEEWQVEGQTRRIIVMVDASGVIDVEKELRGYRSIEWIVIRKECAYPRLYTPSYELNFTDEKQGKALAEELCRTHGAVDGLIDLADVQPHQKQKEEPAWGRISFLQTLLMLQRERGMSLIHVTSGLVLHKNENPTVAGALMAGLSRVIAAEQAKVHVRTIDFDFGIERVKEMLSIALQEGCALTEGIEVCYRAGKRYLSQLRPVDLAYSPKYGYMGAHRIASDKAYVITGGTGGLGTLATKELIRQGARKLALTGISPIPQRKLWTEILENPSVSHRDKEKIRLLQELEAGQVEVLYHAGHLSERDELGRFLNQVRTDLGEIAGVIHCAGTVSHENPSVLHKTRPQMQAIFEPKVMGLNALVELLEKDNLQFFVLYSSISATIPSLGAGVGDYAVANAYMDAIASYGRANRVPIISIQWPSWKETGMGEVSTRSYVQGGFASLSSEEGIQLLHHALSLAGEATVLPAVINPEQFNVTSLLHVKKETTLSKGMPLRSSEAITATENLSTAREWITKVLIEELLIERDRIIGEATFDEYGVDSILMAQLIRKLEGIFGQTLEPSILFEYPTIDSLSAYMAKRCEKTIASHLQRKEITVPIDQGTSPPVGARNKEETIAVTSEKKQNAEAMKIAVIGVACHFPGAKNAEQYWANLKQGKFSVSEVPVERWDPNMFFDPVPQPGKTYGKWGGFLEGIEDFDAAYFQIPEADAPHVDPLARQTLECSVQALCHAGYEKKELWGKKVGVYFGSGTSNYGTRISTPQKGTVTGTNQNFIGAHLAHYYNWHGPNVVLDTACSSSLVAIHMAAQGLAAGDCEMALAGGAELLLDETPYLRLSAAKALSEDGKCHTFDVKANGLVPGEGCGVVILKPLERAMADGDQVYAVLEATSVNNDGHTMGLTTPNLKAQERVIQGAIERAGIDAASISYVEAHGTGTMIGDPIELRALTNVYQKYTADLQFCAVGSVKSNIGHLLLASGIASFIKTVLAIHNGMIPPTIHCEEPNPRFEFSSSPFFPALELHEWKPRHGVRRAGISSFGFGGTNCHVILSNCPTTYLPSRIPLPEVNFNRSRYWMDQEKLHVRSKRRPDMLVLKEV